MTGDSGEQHHGKLPARNEATTAALGLLAIQVDLCIQIQHHKFRFRSGEVLGGFFLAIDAVQDLPREVEELVRRSEGYGVLKCYILNNCYMNL